MNSEPCPCCGHDQQAVEDVFSMEQEWAEDRLAVAKKAIKWWRDRCREMQSHIGDTGNITLSGPGTLMIDRKTGKMVFVPNVSGRERLLVEALRKSEEALSAWEKYGLELWVMKEMQEASEQAHAALAEVEA